MSIICAIRYNQDQTIMELIQIRDAKWCQVYANIANIRHQLPICTFNLDHLINRMKLNICTQMLVIKSFTYSGDCGSGVKKCLALYVIDGNCNLIGCSY